MNLREKNENKGRLMKKLLAFITALVLVLGCTVPSFAKNLNKPTYHTSENVSHPGVTSVTVEGTAAIFEMDSNTDNDVYIRATLPSGSGGKTEYELRHAEVIITTFYEIPSVNYGNITVNPTSSDYVNYQFTYTLDLMNKAYTLVVPSGSYILAAGIDDGVVYIDTTNDPLRLSGTLTADEIPLSVYGSCQNNPYMGNPYYNSGWTFINYFFSATLPTGTDIGDVSGNLTVADGATLSADHPILHPANYNFSSGHNATVTNGGVSRVYYPKLGVTGQTISISQSNYDFNFTELKTSGSTIYTSTIEAKVEAIETAWTAFLAQPATVTTFNSGTTAMDVITRFINWAETTNKPGTSIKYFTGTSNTNGGTYLSCLNGLDVTDCGSNAGYMYATEPYYYVNVNNHCTLGTVGADSYVLTDSTYVVWFYTVNYQNWFNWE